MKTNPTATKMKLLRTQGFKIKVTHFRLVGDERRVLMPVRSIDEENARLKTLGVEPLFISPNGGKVECEIEAPDGRKFVAESECSERDNFKRRIGTAIAFGRAVHQMSLPPAA